MYSATVLLSSPKTQFAQQVMTDLLEWDENQAKTSRNNKGTVENAKMTVGALGINMISLQNKDSD